jgi:hypothetical protein
MRRSEWTIDTLLDECTLPARGDCRLWLRWIGRDGYGVLTAEGRHWRAHRYALHLTGVDLSIAPMVRHSCRQRVCVAPWHLRLGTGADNAQDRRLDQLREDEQRWLTLGQMVLPIGAERP